MCVSFLCIVYLFVLCMCVRRVFWCGVLLHIATCQPPPLPRVRVAPTPRSRSFLLRLICCLHAQCHLYQPPAGPGGKDQKWPPPNIGGFLSSFAQTQKHNKREQIPKVMCWWLKTGWQLAPYGTPPWSDMGGRRFGTANNGDNCRNHNPGVQFNNRQVQLK